MTHNKVCGSLCGGRDGSCSSRHRLLVPGVPVCEGVLIHGSSGRFVAGCSTSWLVPPPPRPLPPAASLHVSARSRSSPEDACKGFRSLRVSGLKSGKGCLPNGWPAWVPAAGMGPAKAVPAMAQSPIAEATATPPPHTADLTGPFFLQRSVWSWRAFNACFCLISQTENISKQAAHAALLTIKRKDHIIAVINH